MKRALIGLAALLGLVAVGLLGAGTIFSGKKTVTKRISVEQKADHVFEVLSAFNRLPEMGVGVKSVKLPADSTLRKGLTFDLETAYGPAKAEVTDLEQDRTLACDLTANGRKLGKLRFELEPSEGTGTDVTIAVSIDSPPPFGGLYNLAAGRAATAALDANADKIKEALETVK